MKLSRRTFLSYGMSGVAVILSGCLTEHSDQWSIDRTLSVTEATLYQPPTCACCREYAAYLDEHLDVGVNTVVANELATIKERHGITSRLSSCHTVELDDYVVEGHIPVEIVALLLEAPHDTSVITLPGMPEGSPGMGGAKTETLTVFSVDQDGRPDVFATF